MLTWESVDRLKESFLLEYGAVENQIETADFARHESKGRLHCGLIAYFSPASALPAKK